MRLVLFLCRLSRIKVMESANFGELNHFSFSGLFYCSSIRTILIQSQMSAAFVVVIEILGQNHVQVFFIKNNDMIQTVSANRANDPLA